VVRAFTWALRGMHSKHAAGIILGDLEFLLSIFTSVIQKLGMEKKPQAAVALLRWLQRQGDDLLPNVSRAPLVATDPSSSRYDRSKLLSLQPIRARAVALPRLAITGMEWGRERPPGAQAHGEDECEGAGA
jgi:hypothetical protein